MVLKNAAQGYLGHDSSYQTPAPANLCMNANLGDDGWAVEFKLLQKNLGRQTYSTQNDKRHFGHPTDEGGGSTPTRISLLIALSRLGF